MSIQDQKPKWALHFKIDDNTWAKLCAHSAKTNLSTLDIAMEMGIMNPEKLLIWDRDTSKTPALKMDFFTSPPPVELFQKFNYRECLQKACLPVTEWNGNIYWAKLSSDPTGFEKENSESLWFLAPWAGLKKWFGVWKSSAFVEPPQKDAPKEIILGEDGPQDFQFGVPDEEVSHSKSFTGTKMVPDPSSDQSSIENTFVEPRLETVILDVPLDSSLSSPQAQMPAPPPAPVTQKEKPLRPETSSKAIDPKIFAPRPPPLASQATNTGSKIIEAPTGLKPFNSEVTAAIDFSSLLGAPIPPFPLAKTPHAPPTMIAPLTASQNSISTIPLDQFESRMRLATTQDALAETFMGAWQNYFMQVMILLFKNDQLCIWWHNHQFKGKFNRGEVIPLDTPSVFKIVADTGHPYHGYVSQGPVNDHFFHIANNGQYPEHLTIIPVLSGDHAIAMIIGLCNREMAKGIVLSKLEDDARLFSSSLTKTSATIKKTG